jgi:AraC family transcriptional regulator of adaptative response/methylated-DNA-[protein]-cysteine methyltransferase
MKQTRQFSLVSEMLYWLVEHQMDQPGLRDLSARFGLSESHLQRMFQEFTGVTPKQYLKFLTKEQALSRLRTGSNVLDASLDCGLSGPGRLHDLLITTEAISPGEARRAGFGLAIHFGYGCSPFGDSLIAWTSRGLCFLGFCRNMTRQRALAELCAQWPQARFVAAPGEASRILEEVFGGSTQKPLKVWLHGSPFQLKVWQALLRIPSGTLTAYGQLARSLEMPRAGRAVGSAIGSNPLSWLIPCHRVITSLGAPGGYRWGIDTKMAMIGVESARAAG